MNAVSNSFPTPVEIEIEIIRAIHADYVRHPPEGDVPFIPARILSLVHNAINRACANAMERV